MQASAAPVQTPDGPSEATAPWTGPLPGAGRSRLVRAGGLVAGAIAAATVLQAVLQFALARVLVPAEYSALVSLFVVVTICAVPTLGVQASVARDVARALAEHDRARAADVLLGTLTAVARVALGALALGAAVGAPLAIVLHVQRVAALAAAAVTLLATAALPVVLGGLQGSRRFGLLAGTQVAWAALRLALALGLALAGYSVGGAMTGIALATLLVLAGALLAQRPLLGSARPHAYTARAWLASPYTVVAAASLSAFTALTSLDVPVARLALDATDAGAYSAASVAARSLLVVPIAATTVLFPRVATLVDPVSERRHLRAGLAVVLAAGAVATAVAASAPRFLLRVGFGSGYESARGYLGLLVAAMALYGLAYVYLYHFLSLGRLWPASAAVAGIAAQAGLYAGFHGDGRVLAIVQVASAGALVAVSELLERSGRP